MTSTVRLGYVRITTTDPPLRVTARLSDEQPKIEAGYGGWEEVARPRKSPLTTFKSSPGLRLTLPIMLDNWSTQQSVEKQISDLQYMGRPVAKDGEPPEVKISAPGGHIPYQNRTWVIADLQFGDALMNANGNRVRQKITLSLLEHVEDVYLTERSAATRERQKQASKKPGAAKKRAPQKAKPPSSKATPRGYTGPRAGRTSSWPFGSGENLARVAARELGDAERWPELAELNGLRDPRAVPFGMVIRLP